MTKGEARAELGRLNVARRAVEFGIGRHKTEECHSCGGMFLEDDLHDVDCVDPWNGTWVCGTCLAQDMVEEDPYYTHVGECREGGRTVKCPGCVTAREERGFLAQYGENTDIPTQLGGLL